MGKEYGMEYEGEACEGACGINGCFRLLLVTFSFCYATQTLNDATLCDVYMLCAATFCSIIVAWHGGRWGGGGSWWGLAGVSERSPGINI